MFTIAFEHIASQHPDVLPLIPEAVEKIRPHMLKNGTHAITIDLGRIIGASVCVKTSTADEIVFARRVGRKVLTRFTKSQQPQNTTKLSLVIAKTGDSTRVVTAYIGDSAPREPGDRSLRTPEEIYQSRKFWEEHALVWGTQQVEAVNPT